MAHGKVIVYAVVGFLCVAAAVLSFAGEGTKIKESETREQSSECIYSRRSPANALGYAAALMLLIAQITISAVTRCACCNRTTPNSTCAIICFIFSWITSAIGIYIITNAANVTTIQQKNFEGIDEKCIYLPTGYFSSGGAAGLVAGALGLYAYYSSTKTSHPPPPAAAPGIAMGYPQFNNPNNNYNNAAAPSHPYFKHAV